MDVVKLIKNSDLAKWKLNETNMLPVSAVRFRCPRVACGMVCVCLNRTGAVHLHCCVACLNFMSLS